MSTRTERMNDKSLNEKHAKILKELMAKPENKICVDCKKKDPRWASWNLGVFFCIRCSGIHRAMGTHISRVKSADLDTWTPEQIQSMLKWGNTKANWYWEHNVTYEPTDSNIEQWIRAKYERKMFARPGPIPDPDTIPIGGAQPSKAPASNPAPVQQQQQQQRQVQSQAPPKPVQPQGADLFSIAQPPSNIPAASASAQQPQADQQLASVFSTQGQQQGYHNFKNNILGLYSSPATTTTTAAPVNGTNMQQSQQSSFANFGSFSSAPQPQVAQSQPMNPSFAAFQSFQSSPPANSNPQIQQQQQNSFANFGSFQSAQPQPQPQNQSFASFSSFQSAAPAPQPQYQPHQQSAQPFGNFQNFTTQSTTQPSFAAFQSIPSTGTGQPNGMQMITGQPQPQQFQQNQTSKSPVQGVQGVPSQTQSTNAFDGLDWGAFK